MKIVCCCGSKNLKKLQFGGHHFRVQPEGHTVFWAFSGTPPEIYVCVDCSRLSFFVDDQFIEKLTCE
jgi:hypothetical protein